MARFSQAFPKDFPPQHLPSEPHLAGRGGATSTQQRQRHGAAVATAEQQPIYVVCKASYPPSGMHPNQIPEAQVSALGNILQEALNAIVGGPRKDGISRGYWDVERELKKFEKSLTILARRARDSVALARLRLEKWEEENAEGVSSRKLSGDPGDGQGEGGRSDSGASHKLEAQDSRSRKSKILRLLAGSHEGTLGKHSPTTDTNRLPLTVNGTPDSLLCAVDKVVEDQVGEQVEERMMDLLQLEDVALNRRGIFQEGVRYMSDMMLGEWSNFLPRGDKTTQPKPGDVRRAVLEMAKWAILKGYRAADEVFRDKTQIHGIIQSRYARGYTRGQQSLTKNAKTLNMDALFLVGIEVAGQRTDPTMKSYWAKDGEASENWDDISLNRLCPWGDKGTYIPSVPDEFGFYPDDLTYVNHLTPQSHREETVEEDYEVHDFSLPKVIQLPFLGWSPISPLTYRSWSTETLLQDTSTNRRLMYERKDLDISRLKELVALKERWQEQDTMYLKRYRRYVVSDPVARGRGWMDESDLSFLPAQAPPVVERVRKPPAALEPFHGVPDAVVEDTESGSEEFVGESERKRQQHISASWPRQPTPVRSRSSTMPGLYTQPLSITHSPESRFGPTGPIVAQIEEVLSYFLASPPAAEERDENAEPKGFKPPSVLGLDSHLSHRSTKDSGHCPPASPPPLTMHAKGEEKPLPSLPPPPSPTPLPDYHYSSSLQSVEGDGTSQTESEYGELRPAPSLDIASAPTASRVSPFILRNFLPEQRPSRGALEAYSRAVKDVHGRIRLPFANDDSDDHGGGGSEKGSRANAPATKTAKGPSLNVPSSDTTGEVRVPGSAITRDIEGGDGGEKEIVEKTKPAKVSAGDSRGRLSRRWTHLRRSGVPTWKAKGGLRGFPGVGV
ncbi:MAG: hypothetical protein M1840_002342 [Geoglossum simile]|nr:MAG: hypothetical protein M1840_002342 [Geoglossum simile]